MSGLEVVATAAHVAGPARADSVAVEQPASDIVTAAEFIGPEDPRWTRALERARHDVYHLPEYAALAARHEGGTAAAFYATAGASTFLAPLLLRPLPPELGAPADWRDAASPYGYPAPIATRPDDARDVAAFLAAFRAAAHERGIVSVFCRLHPLLPLPASALEASGDRVRHGSVVYLDLSRPPEALWSDTRSDHRRGINKLKRAGFTARMDDWSRYDEFVSLYQETMRRVSAQEFYFFSGAYFADLRAALGERLHLCTVHSPAGDVAAAGLFTATSSIVQYHLGGTRDTYLGLSPAKLMMDTVRRWAKDAGRSVLSLGGGLGGSETDSLAHFKAGFSSLRADFFTYRVVPDAERYARLCDAWSSAADGAPADAGFFPLWRAPR